MDEVRRIRLQLHLAVHGGAWHGPALTEILADLSSEEASCRPLPGVHSAWEIALHVIAWIEEVGARARGNTTELDRSADWPVPPGTGPRAWPAVLDRLAMVDRGLQEVLEGMTEADLGRRVAGRGHDVHEMLLGLLQHTAYHAGQVALLKKALRTGRTP